MKSKKIFTIIILIILGVVLANTTLAAFSGFKKLQQTYPAAGGSQLGQTEASKSIPSLVKYLFNLAVWLCILAAILTLIIGGIQYLTSSGDASRMGAARTRIYGSMMGLAILFGTYLVLKTVNPQFVVPKISYVPIKQGIVFFTKSGYCQFMGKGANCLGAVGSVKVDGSIINDLAQDNQAKFVNFSSPDLTAEFGPLVISKCNSGDISITKEMSNEFPVIRFSDSITAKLNFADFEPYTFAFWGQKAQGAKLIFYNQPEYKQTANKTAALTYTYEGLLDKDSKKIDKTTETNSAIKDAIVIKPEYFGKLTHDQTLQDAFGAGNTFGFFTTGLAKYLKASNYFNIEGGGDVNDIKDGETKTVEGCGSDSGGKYFNLMTNADFKATINGDTTNQPNIQHPPLSVRITWTTPGVYLLAADGDERYFDSSERNFKSANVNFDQKAQDIKIINDTTRTYVDENGQSHTQTDTRDFLAILHENDNFSGKLKVFFEQRQYKNGDLPDYIKSTSPKAKQKLIPVYSACGWPIKNDSQAGVEYLYSYEKLGIPANTQISTIAAKQGNFYYWKNYNFGNLPMVAFNADGSVNQIAKNEPIITSADFSIAPFYVKESERYGVFEKDTPPSSIEVFELADDPSVCEEVRLCTEKGGKGYCLAYTNDNNKKDEDNIVYYPMPVYLPVHLPKSPSGLCKDDFLPEFTKSGGGTSRVGFTNNIKSIYISGKCAVVLVGGMEDPSLVNLANYFNYLWKTSKASSRSEVFTTSDGNLEDNQIGQCGTVLGFGRWLLQSCAIAIAVYPIK